MVRSLMPTWALIYSIAFWPALCSLAGLCWYFGDRPQRVTSLAMVIGFVMAELTLSPLDYLNFERRLATIDTIMVCIFTGVAIKWPRLPLICVAAFQLVAAMGHLAKVLQPEMSRLTYALLTGSTAYLLLISLSIDLLLLYRRRRAKAYRPASD